MRRGARVQPQRPARLPRRVRVRAGLPGAGQRQRARADHAGREPLSPGTPGAALPAE